LPIDSEEERERELMSIETTIVSAMGKIGNVSDVDRVLQGKNGFFSPTKYPDADGPTGAMGRVLFVDRFSGARALCIQVSSAYLLSDAELTTMNKWADGKNHSSVFPRVQFRGHNLGGDSEFKIYVECNLSLAGLREEFLVEVINDSLRLWQEAMQYVERINRRIEREKAERKQTEQDARMKARQMADERRARISAAQKNDLEVVLAEIKGLVGLKSVKNFADSLVAQKHLAELRRSHNMSTDAVAPHLVFLGDPGTGKTTVARLVGRLYKGLGLLPKGHVVEVERSSLVGGYLGQTALKTQQMCEKALGGILFIDEAYTLSVNGRDYGDEALATILTFMENNRGKLAVVVAGYPQQMDEMLDSNPGLRSRFDTTITFDNYSPQELMQMFTVQLRQQEYELTESAMADVACMFARASHNKTELNARSVRGLVTRVLGQHAGVLMTLPSPTENQIKRISSLSIPAEWVVGRPLLSTELEEFEG
jgi:AAA+ superfamily predicted ATPase